jgi:hypothetical protein
VSGNGKAVAKTAFPDGRMSIYEIRFFNANGATLLAYVTSCESAPDVSRALAVADGLPYARYEIRRGIRILHQAMRTSTDAAYAPLEPYRAKSSGATQRPATRFPIS